MIRHHRLLELISSSVLPHSPIKRTPKRNKSMRLTSNDDNNLSRQLRYSRGFCLGLGTEMGTEGMEAWQWDP